MRAYETDDGSVVVLGLDEIGSVRPEPSRTIEIEDFVDLADIDPVFFEKSYVVAPQRGAEKPYALLLLAMQRAGRVGIGGGSCSGRSRTSSRSGRVTTGSSWRRSSSATRSATGARARR